MKKKIMTILVCAAVMLSTACSNNENSSAPSGSSSNESSSSSRKSSSSESSTTSSESLSALSESSSSESSTTTESESSSTPPESSAPEVETNGGFAHGKQEGNTYISEFLGLKVEFDDGWTIQTDETLAQTNFISDMSDENTQKALERNAVLYEMVAAAETASNVNIVIENLNITNGGKPLTAEEYIDMVIGNLESQFKEALVDVDVETEKSTTDFLGSEAACINIKIATGGTSAFSKDDPVKQGSVYGSS